MDFDKNISLETEHILLRPLEVTDADALSLVSKDDDNWTWFQQNLTDAQDVQAWVEESCKSRQKNQKYPFLIIKKDGNKAIGSSSYLNISIKDERLEVGSTWLGKEFHSTGLNREAKFLLLSYAFEHLNIKRLEFKTDVLNIRSRKAILKMGAIEEGILRSHMITQGGRRRDTIYFSILSSEWPEVKKRIFRDLEMTLC
ncbi:GNAT family N-acetyltransferase [Rubrolithibacter danxiaensis]|uniref:GNAT family N-acetyltransferase n=1 Tax=Rubrolithibacter danxiaensis TaxID=3390805 RepID=UPI003BF7B312